MLIDNTTKFTNKLGHHENFGFFVSMLNDADRVLPPNWIDQSNICDFGCGDGYFIRMVELMRREKTLKLLDGVETQNEIDKNTCCSYPIVFNQFSILKSKYNVIFSNEVLYTQKKLEEHFRLIYDKLENNGIYFALTGCYIENPYWLNTGYPEMKNDIAKENVSYDAHLYGIVDYVSAAREAGFIVGFKKIQYPTFIMPNKTVDNYMSFIDNVNNHLLFCFVKR